MRLHYLEIVTTEVEATCETYEAHHGLSFGPPDPMLGNGRIADMEDGSRISIRAPMHDTEEPAIRPYMQVGDIEAAITAAEEAGAQFAMKATAIPGQGQFAIYFLGGVQFGLWQV